MDSDEEEDLTMLAIAVAVVEHCDTRIYKQPCRNSALTGHQFVLEVLHGHPARCYDQFRMDKAAFMNLCNILKEKKLLRDSRWVCVEEQVAIFLLTLGHNERNRLLQERFQHSGETISRYFNEVLKAMIEFSKELIRPSSLSDTPLEILNNPKYYPWFKDCIGAIDGTHIKVIVPTAQQLPFFNRKGVVTQNVMAVCSFDLRFTYIYAGWEGSANDSRILWEALRNKRLNFPNPPEGKYYVVDAGYPNMPGFLAPYRKVRYHLQDYRSGGNQRLEPKELFNFRHSSLRNAIERSFGVLKARFPILKEPAPYPFETQVHIVVAACAVHNFIRMQGSDDIWFMMYNNEESVVERDEVQPDEADDQHCGGMSMNLLRQRRQQMNDYRDEIVDAMHRFQNSI